MSTERRWYEPPAPRDWHPDKAQLQRLESAASLRRSVLERSSGIDRASLRSSSSGRSEVPNLDRSLLERNLRGATNSSPAPAPLPRATGLGGPPDGAGRTPGVGLPRSVSSPAGVSVSDLSATYVFPQLWRDPDEVGRGLACSTPPRPRSSSITKYAPLPAIPAASSSKDTNNNQEVQFVPPPLVRSRTFDVLDTTLEELPVVGADRVRGNQGEDGGGQHQNLRKDGELDRVEGGDSPYLVTVSIEGKTLADYLSHARDGLLKSRPATRYGRPDPSTLSLPLPPDLVAALPSTLTPAQWNLAQSIHEGSQGLENNEAVEGHDRRTIDPLQSAFQSQDAESFGGTEPQNYQNTDNVDANSAVNKHDGDTNVVHGDTGISETREDIEGEIKSNMSERVDNLGDKNDDNSMTVLMKGKEHDERDEVRNDHDRDDHHLSDDEINGYVSDDEDEDEEEPKSKPRQTQPATENEVFQENDVTKENQAIGGNPEEDINVYFKLPDDSLLVASSPPGGTLGKLLGVVERTRVGGKRMALLPQDLDQRDLNKTLNELGIMNNTVIYLLSER